MERVVHSPGLTRRCWQITMRHRVLTSCLGAAIMGIGIGILLKFYVPLTSVHRENLGFPGDLLMRMLGLVTIPLIVTSVITGVSGMSVETARKIAIRTALYILASTLISTVLGVILVMILKPGAAYAVDPDDDAETDDRFSTTDALFDLLRNMVPSNMMAACFRQHKSERVRFPLYGNASNSSTNATEVRLVTSHVDGTNVVGLIGWCFIFGVTLNKMGRRAAVLVEILSLFSEALNYGINLILGYLPFGVLFMIISHVVDDQDWQSTFKLAKFILVVMIGLTILSVVVLPAIYFMFVRRNPIDVFKAVSPALVAAMVISSSSATFPITAQCLVETLKVDVRVERFMLPIGTDINMPGTALYEVVAVFFIAQLNNINLHFGQVFTLALTTAVASIGAAGVPASGAVTTLFVLTATGIPSQEASLLVVVEWLLDHPNTFVNVLGNCLGIALISEISEKELGEQDPHAMEMLRWKESSSSEIEVSLSGDSEALFTAQESSQLSSTESSTQSESQSSRYSVGSEI